MLSNVNIIDPYRVTGYRKSASRPCSTRAHSAKPITTARVTSLRVSRVMVTTPYSYGLQNAGLAPRWVYLVISALSLAADMVLSLSFHVVRAWFGLPFLYTL